MVEGLSQVDLDSLFTKFEHLAVILISRNKGEISISDNTFEENISMFGGALTITSPDF